MAPDLFPGGEILAPEIKEVFQKVISPFKKRKRKKDSTHPRTHHPIHQINYFFDHILITMLMIRATTVGKGSPFLYEQ